MEKHSKESDSSIQHNQSDDNRTSRSAMDRRKFVGLTAAAAAFTIVPRHVLGGKNFVAPSDKITLGYVGMGTQGVSEVLPMLAVPEIQIVAVCDPNKEAVGYKNWGPDYLTEAVRNTLGIPNWTPGGGNKIPGGRDNGKFIVDTYYAKKRGKEKFAACRTYADPREMFEKEKDLDAVKVMTPDHLHGVLALAAMKRNKHIVMHKPVANRLLEGKRVLDLAKNGKSVTHLIAGIRMARWIR